MDILSYPDEWEFKRRRKQTNGQNNIGSFIQGGGTGKSNTSANLAALYAIDGLRVGVVDTDIQSPGIHVIFGLDEDDAVYSLNDYLWGKCIIEQTACDVSGVIGPKCTGAVYLIPSSINAADIARVLFLPFTGASPMD